MMPIGRVVVEDGRVRVGDDAPTEPVVPPARAAVCLLWLAVLRVSLLTLGYVRTRRLVERLVRRCAGAPCPAVQAMSWARAAAEAVATAGTVFPGRAVCLEQSLALYCMLHQRQIPAQLRLGVQPVPFFAHAWVELHGEPLNETAERTRHFCILREEGSCPSA